MGNTVAVSMNREMKLPELTLAEGTYETDTGPHKNLSFGSHKRRNTTEDVLDTQEEQGKLCLPVGFEEVGGTELGVSNPSMELSDETKEFNDLQYMEYIKLRGGHWKPRSKEGESSKDQKPKNQTDNDFILGKVPEHMTSDLEPFDGFDHSQSIDLFSLVDESCRKNTKLSYDTNERESFSNYTVLSELSGLEKQGKNISPSRSDIRGESFTNSWIEASSDDSVKDISCVTSGPYTSTGFERSFPRSSDCKESEENIDFSPKFFTGQNMLEVPAKKSVSHKALRDRAKNKPRASPTKKVIKTD